jgi:hypothetical protein
MWRPQQIIANCLSNRQEHDPVTPALALVIPSLLPSALPLNDSISRRGPEVCALSMNTTKNVCYIISTNIDNDTSMFVVGLSWQLLVRFKALLPQKLN